MLSVKYDNTTTWKIDGWLKDTLGHSNSNDESFGQEGKISSHAHEIQKPCEGNIRKKDKLNKPGNGLK